MAEWPDWQKVEEMVSKGKYMAGNTEFQTFKKQVLKASVEEICGQVHHAPTMWDFLIGFAAVKPFYRSLIIQVFNKLMQVTSWVQAWEDHPALQEKVRTLHEELQAALGMQHAVLLKSIAPSALRSMAAVQSEAAPEKVRQDIEKERLVDEIREEAAAAGGEALDAFAADADAPDAPGASHQAAPRGLLSTLQEGIDAVLAVDDRVKMSVAGHEALRRLRIGCIRCAGLEEHFHGESLHAHEVFSFLLSFARDNAEAVGEVAEVLNQLANSPSWAAAFEASQPLKEALRELPEEVQAALGLQHKAVLQLVSAEARRRVQDGNVPEKVRGVAERMKSIRPTAAPSAATPGEGSLKPPPPTEAPPPPPAPLPPDVWREAKTPEGHSYYYNSRTKQSVWERPAALGGPHVYDVGDAVEVWSNSQRAWGAGKVVKVEGEIVLAEFVLPGGAAQKGLPAKHKDLRPRPAAADTEGWSAAERQQYQQCFDSMAGEVAGKPALEVARFLERSGLGRPVLKQVWAVANSGGKAQLGFEEFARCCRLIGHCQAWGDDMAILLEADRALRVKLRTECLTVRPPQLPRFEG